MRLPYIVVSYCIEQCLFCFLFDFVLVIITIVYGNNQGYVTVRITFSEQLIFQDGTLIIFMMSSIINHYPNGYGRKQIVNKRTAMADP